MCAEFFCNLFLETRWSIGSGREIEPENWAKKVCVFRNVSRKMKIQQFDFSATELQLGAMLDEWIVSE
jgi:hypothetical protein